MRPGTLEVIAVLAAAVAFVMAFISVGIFLVSSLFMAIGLAAVGWLAWTLIQKVRARRPRRTA